MVKCWCGSFKRLTSPQLATWKAEHEACVPREARHCRKCGARSAGLCDACVVEELEAKRERLDIADFAWAQVDAGPPIALPLRRYESAVRLEKRRLKRMPVDQTAWAHHAEMARPLPPTESQKARLKYRSDGLFKFFN